MDLGEFGVWTSPRALGDDGLAVAAGTAERLGFGTLWVGGSPQLRDVAPALEATERLTVATGIVNVWATDPTDLAADYAALRDAHGDRLLVGIGIGHREATAEYERPLATMRSYLDAIDAAPRPIPRERRVLAALGPGMLDLSAQRAAGTHPYFVPAEHVRLARERVGPDALVVPELSAAIDEDPATAREIARRFASFYLGLSNYAGNLRRIGFDEEDVADGGSDRLLDAVVPQGTAQRIAEVALAFRSAGADHVAIQAVGTSGLPEREWTGLAAALGLGA